MPEIAHSGNPPAIVECLGLQKFSLNCVGGRDRRVGLELAAGAPQKIP